MNHNSPPRWLERSLLLLLCSRDRETISGDLQEAYAEDHLPRLGRLRANLWYAREVISLTPRFLLSEHGQRPVLALICVFTALSGCWLGLVGLFLKRPVYIRGEVISAIIAVQALLTLAALRTRRVTLLRPVVVVGCAAILWLAGEAIVAAIRGADIEGYVLLISFVLTCQALLTLRNLAWKRMHRRPNR